MRTDDGCIIRECLGGESEAFGVLVDKYKGGIYAFAYAKLGNFQDAQDVTQEAFLKAYRNLRSLRRWESFGFWLYRIAYNLCGEWIKARARRPDREFIEDQDPRTLASSSLDFHREYQLDESVQDALDSLPQAYREVLMLHYFGGMNSKEIARVLGTSPTAVRMRLSRARAQLREEMVAMMDTAFEGHKLQASFTFRIVEGVKRIKINPMPRMTALPWGLSLAAGIIITVLSLNPYLNILNPASSPTYSQLPVEAKPPKTGEVPVDVLSGSRILAISGKQEDSAKAVRFAPTIAAADTGRIVFQAYGWEEGDLSNRSIWIMDTDGGNRRELIEGGIEPEWSPDGKSIAFSLWINDGWDIHVMNADGSSVKQLTDLPGWERLPKWSPDGKRIVFDFFDDKENRGAVYVMDADGSKMKSLLEDPKADAGGPLWSPDGKRIAYWYWPVDKPQLWVMDANGENRKMLHWWGGPTDWSPGGDKILFISGQDSWKNWKTNDIYVINANGTGLKRLTEPGPTYYFQAVWLPDESGIAFCPGDPLPDGIYVMNVDGSNVRQIADFPKQIERLDWTTFSYAVEPAGKLPTTWGETRTN